MGLATRSEMPLGSLGERVLIDSNQSIAARHSWRNIPRPLYFGVVRTLYVRRLSSTRVRDRVCATAVPKRLYVQWQEEINRRKTSPLPCDLILEMRRLPPRRDLF